MTCYMIRDWLLLTIIELDWLLLINMIKHIDFPIPKFTTLARKKLFLFSYFLCNDKTPNKYIIDEIFLFPCVVGN